MDLSTLGGTALAGVILGVVLPLIIAVVKQPGWSDTVNRLVVLAVCLVFSFALYVAGDPDLSDFRGDRLVVALGAVFVAATQAYEKAWKPVADRIEDTVAVVAPDKRVK